MRGSAVLSARVEERGVRGEVAGVSVGEGESFVGPEDGCVVKLPSGVELRLRANLVQQKRHNIDDTRNVMSGYLRLCSPARRRGGKFERAVGQLPELGLWRSSAV